MKKIILLPTINEEKNLKKLLPRIPKEYDLLILDYKSNDNTTSVGKKHGAKTINIEKKGLGNAYIIGFKYAIQNEYEILFEMDADLSHNPNDLKRLEKNLNTFDVVIGSRYIQGGKINGWNIYRKFVSKISNIFARKSLKTTIKDLTSGYRAIKISALKNIDLDHLNVSGYAFQISLINELLKKESKIKEIPITFTERKIGKSKLEKKDIKEFFIYCIKKL